MTDESIALFEGECMPLKMARLSIVNPALTKSDIVFDVVSACDGVFFRLDDHLDRFENSCRSIRIKPAFSRDEIKAHFGRMRRSLRLQGCLRLQLLDARPLSGRQSGWHGTSVESL